jgi:hypothetical protein
MRARCGSLAIMASGDAARRSPNKRWKKNERTSETTALDFAFMGGSTLARRVVAKMEFHYGNCLRRVGFIVTKSWNFKPGGGALLQQSQQGRIMEQRK